MPKFDCLCCIDNNHKIVKWGAGHLNLIDLINSLKWFCSKIIVSLVLTGVAVMFPTRFDWKIGFLLCFLVVSFCLTLC
jgi:hypothetical protein